MVRVLKVGIPYQGNEDANYAISGDGTNDLRNKYSEGYADDGSPREPTRISGINSQSIGGINGYRPYINGGSELRPTGNGPYCAYQPKSGADKVSESKTFEVNDKYMHIFLRSLTDFNYS